MNPAGGTMETEFSLSESQIKKLNEWSKTLPDAYTGAVGGRFTYSFTPTSIGVFITAQDCITKKELDLSEV